MSTKSRTTRRYTFFCLGKKFKKRLPFGWKLGMSTTSDRDAVRMGEIIATRGFDSFGLKPKDLVGWWVEGEVTKTTVARTKLVPLYSGREKRASLFHKDQA